jgi:AraC-like DNA-binding protein
VTGISRIRQRSGDTGQKRRPHPHDLRTKHSLLNRIFVLLALFLLVPVVAMFLLSDLSVMGVVQDQIGATSMDKLRVAASVGEIIDDEVKSTCARIALDPRLARLSETRRFDDIYTDSDTLFSFYDYGVFLDNQVRTNVTFHSIHIQIDGTDYVVSSVDGTTPLVDFSDAVWLGAVRATGAARSGAFYARPHVPGRVAWPTPTEPAGNPVEQVISYVYPLSSYLTGLKGLIVLNIKEPEYSSLINSSNPDAGGSIAILDELGFVLSHANNSLVGSSLRDTELYRRIEESDQSVGYFILRGDSTDQLVSWLRDDRSGRLLVGEFSLTGLRQRVSGIRMVFSLIAVGIVLVGIVVSRLVSARITSPVRRLLRQVEERRGHYLGRAGTRENDELTLLARAFDTLAKREQQLFSTQRQEAEHRKETWVRQVIRGTAKLSAAKGRPKGHLGARCAAAVLAIDGYAAFVDRTTAEEREHLQSILVHMAEEAFLPEVRCFGANHDRGVMLLVTTDEIDDSLLYQRIDEGFATLLAETRTALQTSVTLGVGTFAAAADLRASWNEARELARRRFIAGPARWFSSRDSRPEGSTAAFPRREERQIVASLGALDRAGIDSGLTDLMQSIRQQEHMSPDQVMVILNQLLGSILKQLLESETQLSAYFGHDYNLYAALAEKETLEEVDQWLRTLLGGVVDINAQISENDREYSRMMVDFIRRNYRSDIGVEHVATHAGLSYSHARKVFRDEFGDTIVNYTNEIRIEEVQRLLRETDQKLDQIAKSVGYNNTQSLNRYFRKFTGLRPGEYRAQCRAVG